jgi:hypothetical protein
MIANMRHRLVLSLYSTVATTGLAVFAYGLFNFIGALLFLPAALSAQAGGGRAQIGAVATIVGMHLLVTLAGGTVAFFAGRTWWRRRRAGPAPEEASVARTSLGRILATLIFGAFAFISGVTLYYALGAVSRDAALAATGITTTAGIASFEPDPAVHEDAFCVHYVFETPDGRRVVGVTGRWRWQVEALQKAGTTEVTYLPKDPQVSRLEFSFSLQETLQVLGTQFAVFLVGIWGAGKNLGIWPNGRRDAAGAAGGPGPLPAGRRGFGAPLR